MMDASKPFRIGNRYADTIGNHYEIIGRDDSFVTVRKTDKKGATETYTMLKIDLRSAFEREIVHPIA